MFIAIKAVYGEFLGDCEVLGSYGTMKEAEKAIMDDAWDKWSMEDASEFNLDEPVHNGTDSCGMPYAYDDDGREWRVFEA